MCLRPPPPQKKLHPILFGFSKRCISMYFLFYQRESKEIALNTAMIFTTNSTPPAACVQLDTLSGPWTRLVLLGFTWKSLGTTCQHFFGNSGPLPFAYCSLEPQSPSLYILQPKMIQNRSRKNITSAKSMQSRLNTPIQSLHDL